MTRSYLEMYRRTRCKVHKKRKRVKKILNEVCRGLDRFHLLNDLSSIPSASDIVQPQQVDGNRAECEEEQDDKRALPRPILSLRRCTSLALLRISSPMYHALTRLE